MQKFSTASATQTQVYDDTRKARAKAVRVEDEIARRGVRLKGRRHLFGPCPKCGGDDRFWVNKVKQKFGCRQCRPRSGDVIDLVQFLDGRSFGEAIDTLVGERPKNDPKKIELERAEVDRQNRDDEKEQLRKAQWLWSRREPITGTTAETYLREARGYAGPIPSTLFYLPTSDRYPPAMMAPFGLVDEVEPGALASISPGAIMGVHLTKLKPDGSSKAYDEETKERKNKTMHGIPVGWPIVLAPPNDLLGLAITEGIEDGLSVYQATGLGVWAAGSATFMPKLAQVVPSYIECVTIAVDDNKAGRDGANGLTEGLRKRGIYVERIMLSEAL
jgi:hypothetical protein